MVQPLIGPDCQKTFDRLKQSLITPPVLCYPKFDSSFVVLEKDASIKSIGAILSQVQEDGQCHPGGYASQSHLLTETTVLPNLKC